MADPTDKPRAFFDSNVWLYALAGAADPAKQSRAANLIAASARVVSTQVVNEVTNNLLRKHARPESQIRTEIDQFYANCEVVFYANCEVVAHDRDLQLDASRLRERYQFSPYDGLIVAAALRAGVDTLYTEDLQDRLVIRGSVTVVNPFAAAPASP